MGSAPDVVIDTESTALRLYGTPTAVGRRFRIEGPPDLTVVGVAHDIRATGLTAESQPVPQALSRRSSQHLPGRERRDVRISSAIASRMLARSVCRCRPWRRRFGRCEIVSGRVSLYRRADRRVDRRAGMLATRRIWMLRSTDDGRTFSPPLLASEHCGMRAYDVAWICRLGRTQAGSIWRVGQRRAVA